MNVTIILSAPSEICYRSLENTLTFVNNVRIQNKMSMEVTISFNCCDSSYPALLAACLSFVSTQRRVQETRKLIHKLVSNVIESNACIFNKVIKVYLFPVC